MKSIILLALIVGCALAQTLTDEQRHRLKTHREECIKQTGCDPDIHKKALEGRFLDDDKSKKFWLCMNKKIGFQNENGLLLRDVVERKNRKIWGEEKARHVAEECVKQKSTPEDTALEYARCSYKRLHGEHH